MKNFLKIKAAALLAALTLLASLTLSAQVSGSAQAPVAAQAPGRQGTMIPSGKAFLEQLQKRDSVLIADQLRYGFRLDGVAAGTAIELPDVSDGLMDSVEVVRSWALDTLSSRKHKSEFDIEGSLVITSFDEGKYRLPGIPVRRVSPDGTADTLLFEGLELDVFSMPVDTTTYVPHDIKGQIRYPLTWAEVWPWIVAFQILAVLVILIVSLLMIRRSRTTGETQSKEPPYIVALKKLDKFRGNKYWAPEKQKQFYSGITDVLREYMASRFGIGAMEMTTAEIFEALKGADIPQDIMEESRNLFVMSDFVKFAKMTVSDDDNVKAVPSAVRFVTTTWKSEEENSPEAEKTDGRKKKAAEERTGAERTAKGKTVGKNTVKEG